MSTQLGDAPAVMVCVRVRPLTVKEHHELEAVEVPDEKTVSIDQHNGQSREFRFDRVLGEDATQEDVYEATGKPILLKAVQGYNGTIFAYGQTGSGKTYTMLGEEKYHNHGVVQHLCKHLFTSIRELSDTVSYECTASYLQIYQEVLLDLLANGDLKSTGWIAPNSPKRHNDVLAQQAPDKPLHIRHDKVGLRGIYVENAREVPVESEEEIMDLLAQGERRRVTGSTSMNKQSSRSHAILTIRLRIQDKEDPDGTSLKMSKISLIDLAGSERQSLTEASGNRLREGSKINQSLSALGNVVKALTAKNKGHIPYRDSLLTRLLMDSLGMYRCVRV